MSAKETRDTLYSPQGDKIILNYNVSTEEDGRIAVKVSRTRIIPTEALRKACKGDFGKLKLVVFDQVNSYGQVKWDGMTPSAFMVPSGMTCEHSYDGFYILGESEPIVFNYNGSIEQKISFPVYIALCGKKQSYKILSTCSKTLDVLVGDGYHEGGSRDSSSESSSGGFTVQSQNELEAEKDDEIRAENSIHMIRKLLETETELPFSQTLSIEISNLHTIQDRIRDKDMLEKISSVFLECYDKEQELKENQKMALLSNQAQQQRLISEQKQADDKRRKQEDEKSRIEEEKREKRTIWMIIGGAALAALGFVGNAVSKHFRDVRNQKSLMQMQESLIKQAKHDAAHRSREIVVNKTHQAVNKGRGKLRNTLNSTSKTNVSSKRKSI